MALTKQETFELTVLQFVNDREVSGPDIRAHVKLKLGTLAALMPMFYEKLHIMQEKDFLKSRPDVIEEKGETFNVKMYSLGGQGMNRRVELLKNKFKSEPGTDAPDARGSIARS